MRASQQLMVILVVVIVATFFVSCLATRGPQPSSTNASVSKSTPTPSLPQVTPTATPIILPPEDVSKILGVDVSVDPNADKEYPGIFWVRMGYPSCGNGNLQGQVLRDTLQSYHKQGIHVLVTVCQNNSGNLDDTAAFNDVAQSHPDAVQCGNEEMKQDASVALLYTPPDKFAQFYDLCQQAIHAVDQNIPVLLGSLDPHVAGPDYQLMVSQVNYLDQMQSAMKFDRSP